MISYHYLMPLLPPLGLLVVPQHHYIDVHAHVPGNAVCSMCCLCVCGRTCLPWSLQILGVTVSLLIFDFSSHIIAWCWHQFVQYEDPWLLNTRFCQHLCLMQRITDTRIFILKRCLQVMASPLCIVV